MTTHLSEEPLPSQGRSNDTRIRYIEELAGEEDAWVSVTDAARITRTSEAMARRWVTSGRLPVKRQAVGINQHTSGSSLRYCRHSAHYRSDGRHLR